MIPIKTSKHLEIRNDPAGLGTFGAIRGSRSHRGVDFLLRVREELLSPVTGTVTKLGYPYSDDLSYRYIEVRLMNGTKHRFFYVNPEHEVGAEIQVGTRLGTAQHIVNRYPNIGMKNHIHYEIKDDKGRYIDPEEYWGA